MPDWENLRHFLAVAWAGSLSGAARSLKVDHATVSRRLTALEAELDVRLVDRLPKSCRLTPTGQAVYERGLAMEDAVNGIERIAKAAQKPEVAQVTLSAPPVLVTHVLAGNLARFQADFPDIRLSLVAQAQQVSLSKREADIAVRLVRPQEPSNVARRIGHMDFGLYARRGYAEVTPPENRRFITYDRGVGDIPQQRWILAIAGGRPVSCELSDISGHSIAARAGAGVAGLPRFLGDGDPDLARVEEEYEPFSRDIWLVVHEDLRHAPALRAVMDFVASLIAESPGLALR